jgi:hypothetical protein
MDWRLTLYYASLSNPTSGPGMPFDEVDTINE